MTRTISNDFCIADIESKIKGDYHTTEYLRGYIAACYILGVIEKEEADKLKKLLKIREEKLDDKN